MLLHCSSLRASFRWLWTMRLAGMTCRRFPARRRVPQFLTGLVWGTGYSVAVVAADGSRAVLTNAVSVSASSVGPKLKARFDMRA